MTDAFESEVQRFVAKQNGDDLTPRVVYGMLLAVNEDAVHRHRESAHRQDKIVEMLETHCDEAVIRDRRITDLEAWRLESQATCSAKVTALIEREHAERHGHHMEAEHGDDFNSRLVVFFATTIGKLAIFVAGGVTLAAINWLLF